MRWYRRVSPAVFLFLTFLFHCSQTCLAADHAHAAVTVPISTDHDAGHTPCHSSSSPSQRLPEKCSDCADHVFLTPVAAGTETLATPGPAVAPGCLLTQSLLSSQPPLCLQATQPVIAALSPPRYLTFAILRL